MFFRHFCSTIQVLLLLIRLGDFLSEASFGKEIALRMSLISLINRENYSSFLRDTSNISIECKSSIQEAISFPSLTSMKMLDASAKIPMGVLFGNKNNIGDRVACINARSVNNSIRPRYYLVEFITTSLDNLNPITLYQHGFCIPHGCTPEDIRNGFEKKVANFTIGVQIDDDPLRTLAYTVPEVIFLFFSALIMLIVIIGTILDSSSCSNNFFWKILVMFSASSNIRALLHIEQVKNYEPRSTKRLESLDGLRCMSITWVIIGHIFFAYQNKVEDSLSAYNNIIGSYWGQTVTNAFCSVDSFFVLSGLLVSYLTMNELEKTKGQVNWFLFYFHRYVRITLVYAVIVLFFATVYRHMGESSMAISNTVDACKKLFVTNILYVGNFLSRETICIEQAWYLNVDMQMFIVSPFFIFPLWKWWWIGFLLACFMIVVSTGLLAWAHFDHRDLWGATLLGSNSDSFFVENYNLPWMRIQPYVTGIILGALLFRVKSKWKMSRIQAILGWIVAFGIGFSTIFGLNLSKYAGNVSYLSQSVFGRIAYGSLHRLSWGLALGWVIFACETGYGFISYKFLSWEFFKPWSKITFMIFLTHMQVIEVYFDNFNFVARYSVTFILVWAIGIMYISAVLSAAVFVILEMPLAKLEKYLISKVFQKKTTTFR